MAEDAQNSESPSEAAAVDDKPAEPAPQAEAPKTEPAPTIGYAEDDAEDESLLNEFLLFLKEEKKWWLAPLVLVLLFISAIIVFAEGSAIAPFIYTIF